MKCIIIEDELPGIKLLKSYIDKTFFLECIGIFNSVSELPFGILDKTDFIFLDIQLPGINGLDFLKNIEKKPRVIITTAYRDYAIDAFDQGVVDYLLKPFSYERFLKSIYRLHGSIKFSDKEENKNDLFVYADKTFFNINKKDIFLIKAEVDYVKIFYENKNLLVQDSMNSWENKLKEDGFIRVHRSYLINLSKIIKIEGNLIYIKDQVIPVGKTYQSIFFDLIKKL
ncbi:LytR/AlgR family response regulator transcription factor [Chryseobacterium sp.]